ncbi:MAG: hypothetical protein ACE5KU_03135, partial [Nitrososphaerales archaeon]
IRRGKDTARVSLIFDNRPVDGRRPIPFSRSDNFMLSRYLRRDGSYWYEADYREVSKSEVLRLFNRAGVNPDNMLIIMHQGMVEEFSVTTPQEKLKMIEEAVGFREYREKVLSAQKKLEELVSEEGSLLQVLEDAGQTAEYWKDLYDKYLLKKSLLEKKTFLERELIWAQAVKLETSVKNLERKLEGRESILNDTLKKMEETGRAASETHSNLEGAQTELRKLYFTLMRMEKEKTALETAKKTLEETRLPLKEAMKLMQDIPLPSEDSVEAKKVKTQIDSLQYSIQNSYTRMEEYERRAGDIEEEVKAVQGEIGRAEKIIDRTTDRYINLKVEEGVLKFKRKSLQREITELKRSIRDVKRELEELSPQLEAAQPRIDTERPPSEVSEEIRINAAHLRTVEDVPEEAERMYTDYTATYEELKEKLRIVSENKEIALKEVEERKKVWRASIQALLREVNPLYHDILSRMGGTGVVKFSDLEDIESSGLELWVGFRGASPTVLDAYTQSGGERSVAVIAFLLSLQSSVISPFRAVDEFDVHMDPRNRESIFKMIFQYVREDPATQYLVITPSQITVTDPDAHLVFVQNVHGRSEVKEVKMRG